MTRLGILMAGVAVHLPLLAGCGDFSSAREPAAGSTQPPGTSAATTSAALGPASAAAGDDASAVIAAASSPAAGEAVVEATFDDVKFPMEKTERFDRSMLTPKVQSLFGKQIRIRGYMYPTLRKKGLTQFVLVRDNLECCFGPGAALFDCILVTMAPGKTAEYSIRPIAVEGAFRLEELPGPDGRPLAIYQMRGEAVTTGG
ncbi:MAG: hypothetical protein DCC67_17495 [Planctomycetota bacterium]|nr:MAG: hypothetical protein DCC67_17495 [Planctomycetota bacterium]